MRLCACALVLALASTASAESSCDLKLTDWSGYLARIWVELLKPSLDTANDVLVEVGPGGTDKLGRALADLKFAGTLYIIEPHKLALAQTLEIYKRILPKARLIGLPYGLGESVAHLPKRVDMILANHPLDDMIIGHALTAPEFKKFFANHYDQPGEITAWFWEKLAADPPKRGRATQKVIEEWCTSIAALNPRLVAMSQYESYFFKVRGITKPDETSLKLLARLREVCLPGALTEHDRNILERHEMPPERWLLSYLPH